MDRPRTAFTQAVRRVVADLPSGEVATYGEVAMEAGRPGAARAVGRVLREDGDGLPWWRVVPASGRLAPHLVERQSAALAAEGVPVRAGQVRLASTPAPGHGRELGTGQGPRATSDPAGHGD